MMNYNPNLIREQNVSSDPISALRNLTGANNQLNNVLLNIQRQKNLEDEAKAKVSASDVANQRDLGKLAIMQNYAKENLGTQFQNDLAISDLRNKFTSSENAKNRFFQEKLANEANANKAIAQDQQNKFLESLQDKRLKAQLGIALAKDKPVDLTKEAIKAAAVNGGLDTLVNNNIQKLDNQDWFVSGMDENSRSDLKAMLMQKLQDPKEKERFLFDQKGYVDEIRKESGDTSWKLRLLNILPFGDPLFERSFTPNVKQGK